MALKAVGGGLRLSISINMRNFRISGRLFLVSFAEGSRRQAGLLLEGAAEIAAVGKTAQLHDLADAVVRFDKHPLGLSHAAGLQKIHDGYAGHAAESVRQRRNADVVSSGEFVQGILLRKMIFQPALDIHHNIIAGTVDIYVGASVQKDQQLLH